MRVSQWPTGRELAGRAGQRAGGVVARSEVVYVRRRSVHYSIRL
jgi:hypothetical protein